jgi:hypothetical protein
MSWNLPGNCPAGALATRTQALSGRSTACRPGAVRLVPFAWHAVLGVRADGKSRPEPGRWFHGAGEG